MQMLILLGIILVTRDINTAWNKFWNTIYLCSMVLFRFKYTFIIGLCMEHLLKMVWYQQSPILVQSLTFYTPPQLSYCQQ